MSKRKKKNKKLIEISREEWLAMQNRIVICNHSDIDYFTKHCRICGKSLMKIESENSIKKKNKEEKTL